MSYSKSSDIAGTSDGGVSLPPEDLIFGQRCHRCCDQTAAYECVLRQATWRFVCEACFQKDAGSQYLYVPPDGRRVDNGAAVHEVQEIVVYDGTTESSRRIADLERVLRSLVVRIRKVGGYSTPEEQDVLWEAERVLGGLP